MLEAVQDMSLKKNPVLYTSYLPNEIGTFLRSQDFKTAAVLLSGDVGFCSGAKKLMDQLEDFQVELVPGITSMVYFCSKLKISWEDVKFGSAHGKKINMIQRINRYKKTFFLLDGKNGLQTLCEKLIYYGMNQVTLHVGENLSYDNETIFSGKPEEIVSHQVSSLVVVLIENSFAQDWTALSIPDEEFIRAKVPMTKCEVRNLSVGKLKLTPDAVVYDVGAGSGSVSIEVALQAPDIKVYAIEKKPEAIELLEQNKRKFAADNMEIIKGVAPEAIAGLESPTHAFIGGSSGNMEEIIDTILGLNEDCRIVLNTIAINTFVAVMDYLEAHPELDSDIVQIQSSYAKKVGAYQMMMGQNPIYIISIWKK